MMSTHESIPNTLQEITAVFSIKPNCVRGQMACAHVPRTSVGGQAVAVHSKVTVCVLKVNPFPNYNACTIVAGQQSQPMKD